MPQPSTKTRTALVFLAAVCLPSAADAQRRSKTPEVESKTLTTKDGVALHIKYYPSNAGRDAAPVVLLHDLKESGQAMSRLARRLHQPPPEAGHPPFAVVTVDLRGHGDSRQQAYGGRSRELDAMKLRVEDMRGMVLGDMEAVRKFLVKENDAGRLNLNRLALIGCGMGAVVATNFAANDWDATQLPTIKQGQDVKALVLISPEWKSKGIGMQAPLRQAGVQREVAVLLLYGREERKRARDADRVYGQLERGHPELKSKKRPDAAAQLSELPPLMKIGVKTKLQGTQLLAEKTDKVEQLITRFVVKHTGSEEFKHSTRRLD